MENMRLSEEIICGLKSSLFMLIFPTKNRQDINDPFQYLDNSPVEHAANIKAWKFPKESLGRPSQ